MLLRQQKKLKRGRWPSYTFYVFRYSLLKKPNRLICTAPSLADTYRDEYDGIL